MRGDTEFRQKSWPETCKELGINPELSPVEVEDKLLTAIYGAEYGRWYRAEQKRKFGQ